MLLENSATSTDIMVPKETGYEIKSSLTLALSLTLIDTSNLF
jgi:hypothetical protein